MRWYLSACWLTACLLLLGRPDPASNGSADDERTLDRSRVGTDGASLLEFFRHRTVRADQQQVRDLIRQLGSRSFAARADASAKLTALGARAVPQLRLAARNLDPEVRRRAAFCLGDIANRDAPALVTAAARQLAVQNPVGAAEALLDFLPAVVDDKAAEEIFQAVAKVAVRHGKPEPAILRALTDAEPLRRCAAAVALSRAGAQAKKAVRPLLRDPVALVRLHAVLSLVRAGDREAIPALIGLFEALPRNKLWRVEDVLYRLAGAKAPGVAPGSDAVSHRAFRTAWMGWWRTHGNKVDLKRAGYRDHTLVVLLDESSVLDLDADDKVRFRIGKIGFPLDVQALPGERVLLAEHGANRVTERLRDGTILWEQKADGPLVAQRLPNGNTFIATKDRLSEVDREGKEVFSYVRSGRDQFMRALVLPDGTIACVAQNPFTRAQLCLRLDRSGKELSSFGVRVYTFGGRLDVQPNGRVLIPQMYQNKVVEYDAAGKVVREFSVSQPIAAVRLANGNTLITSMTENRAVEFDLAGKQVWEYRARTRVTRAYRR